MNKYIDNEPIVKEIVFEFLAIYGPSNEWTSEIKELFEEEIKKRIRAAE